MYLDLASSDEMVSRFFNEAGGFLNDVVDVDHLPGKVDVSFRPNQIFAVGELPVSLVERDRARRVVDAVGYDEMHRRHNGRS